MGVHIDKARRDRIDREYTELRARDPRLLSECVQSADAIVMNHHEALGRLDQAQQLRLKADIEQTLVSLAVRLGREVPF